MSDQLDIVQLRIKLNTERRARLLAEGARKLAESCRDQYKAQLEEEEKERRRIESILEESMNYRSATLHKLQDERERADVLVSASSRMLEVLDHTEDGYADALDAVESAIETIRRARDTEKLTRMAKAAQAFEEKCEREGSPGFAVGGRGQSIPVRIGPPLEFNSNDDLHIDDSKEDE
jgi:hypothetical protein